MAYNPLKLGSRTASAEPISTSLSKINTMLSELFTTTPGAIDWNNFTSSIVPDVNSDGETGYDLGSPTKQWRSLYVSTGTIYLGGTSLSVTEDGSLTVGGTTYAPSADWNDLINVPSFSSVAFTGSYNDLADKPNIPSLAGYATQSYVSSAVATSVNSAISNLVNSAPTTLDTLNELAQALGNDSNFSTTVSTALGNRLRVDTPSQNLTTQQKSNAVTNLGLSAVAISGSYADLSSKPNIPQSTSDLFNNSGFITSGDITWNNLLGKPSFAAVATSGSYADLTSKPTIDTLVPSQATNNGKFLTTNGSTVSWSPIVLSINNLSNVSITNPSSGQVLKYNGSAWVNGIDQSGTGGGGGTLGSRTTVSGTTASIADNETANILVEGFKGYVLYKIETSAAAWVRVYTSQDARTADANRTINTDPLPGAGVIAEVISTGAQTINLAPGVIGFNDESTPTTDIVIAITNKSGATTTVSVTLTILQLEA